VVWPRSWGKSEAPPNSHPNRVAAYVETMKARRTRSPPAPDRSTTAAAVILGTATTC